MVKRGSAVVYAGTSKTVALALAALVPLAVTGAGCGGSDSTLSATAPNTATTTSGSTTAAGGAGGTSTTAAGGAGGTSTTGQGGKGGSGGSTSTGGGGGSGGAGGGACVPTPEQCNGIDDDCDGQIDNGDPGGGAACDTGLNGICATGVEHCTQGVMSCVPDHGPGEVAETCNGLDDDCDGQTDEGLPVQTYYKDDDGDGYGSQASIEACEPPAGYATKSGDCNDNNADIHPGALELCNGVDDNCNGFVDENLSKITFYEDSDGDGYGGPKSIVDCNPPPGYVAQGNDCDDNNPDVHPGAKEICNGVDDNCNGVTDEGVQTTYYKDNDGDGYGGVTSILACSAPAGYAAEAGDCNDFNKNIYPTAPELCNGVDDDCNGIIDDGLPLADIYTDLDGDGHGGKNALPNKHCLIGGTDPPFGYSLSHDDCDDSKSTVYPGAPELCDGVLNDCTQQVTDYQCPTKCAGSWPVDVGGSAGSPVIAQLDADAEWEVVVQQGGKTIALDHDGTVKWTAVGQVYGYAALGDFDHNGWLDVAVPDGSKVSLVRGTDGVVLGTAPSPNSNGYRRVAVFDTDNDGWADVAPFGGPALDLIKLGAGPAVLSVVTSKVLAGEPGFETAAAGLADLDGDGLSEIFAGSGTYTCAANPATCKGRFYAWHPNGSPYNDPSWLDPKLPQFKVTGYPNVYAAGPPIVADLDHDGTVEIAQPFSDKVYVWKLDGTDHPLSGKIASTRLAPIDAKGVLTDGTLKAVSGAVVDLEGDGAYETVGPVAGGMGVTRGGKLMDGYPIPITGSAPVVGDLNRDGALDIVWLGSNNALNCWTMKPGTYDAKRILQAGGLDSTMGELGLYPTMQNDPYEPNQPAGAWPDPKVSTNPRADFRAFVPYGLRDKFQIASGNYHRVTGLIGSKGDVDAYWFTNSWSPISVTSNLPGKLVLDLDVYVYVPSGPNWAYSCEAHLTKTTNGGLTFNWPVQTGTCPVGMNGTKGFLVRVQGHDPAVDFGPWPYSLSFVWN